jgi:hypothetical protein
MKTHKETISLETEGITVFASIDYDKGTVTLVEKQQYKPKQWLFKDRELEYMNGWIAILNAQIAMVEECKKRLSAFKEEKEAERLEAVKNVNELINERNYVK